MSTTRTLPTNSNGERVSRLYAALAAAPSIPIDPVHMEIEEVRDSYLLHRCQQLINQDSTIKISLYHSKSVPARVTSAAKKILELAGRQIKEAGTFHYAPNARFVGFIQAHGLNKLDRMMTMQRMRDPALESRLAGAIKDPVPEPVAAPQPAAVAPAEVTEAAPPPAARTRRRTQ